MTAGPVNRAALESFYQNPGDVYDDSKTEGAFDVVADQIDENWADYAALKSTLKSSTAGASGAEYINSAPITGMSGTTVHDQLEELEEQIQSIVGANIPAGTIDTTMIQDGAVTVAKLNSDVGDVSATPNTLVERDATGRFEVVTPTESTDITTKEYVDNAVEVASTPVQYFYASKTQPANYTTDSNWKWNTTVEIGNLMYSYRYNLKMISFDPETAVFTELATPTVTLGGAILMNICTDGTDVFAFYISGNASPSTFEIQRYNVASNTWTKYLGNTAGMVYQGYSGICSDGTYLFFAFSDGAGARIYHRLPITAAFDQPSTTYTQAGGGNLTSAPTPFTYGDFLYVPGYRIPITAFNSATPGVPSYTTVIKTAAGNLLGFSFMTSTDSLAIMVIDIINDMPIVVRQYIPTYQVNASLDFNYSPRLGRVMRATLITYVDIPALKEG